MSWSSGYDSDDGAGDFAQEPKAKQSEGYYWVEVAPDSRGNCFACKKPITKGSVRWAVQPPTYCVVRRHVSCVTQLVYDNATRRHPGPFEQFPGMGGLNGAQRSQVLAVLRAYQEDDRAALAVLTPGAEAKRREKEAEAERKLQAKLAKAEERRIKNEMKAEEKRIKAEIKAEEKRQRDELKAAEGLKRPATKGAAGGAGRGKRAKGSAAAAATAADDAGDAGVSPTPSAAGGIPAALLQLPLMAATLLGPGLMGGLPFLGAAGAAGSPVAPPTPGAAQQAAVAALLQQQALMQALIRQQEEALAALAAAQGGARGRGGAAPSAQGMREALAAAAEARMAGAAGVKVEAKQEAGPEPVATPQRGPLLPSIKSEAAAGPGPGFALGLMAAGSSPVPHSAQLLSALSTKLEPPAPPAPAVIKQEPL